MSYLKIGRRKGLGARKLCSWFCFDLVINRPRSFLFAKKQAKEWNQAIDEFFREMESEG